MKDQKDHESLPLALSSKTQTRLSVNINKIATLRNSRGGNHPDLIQVAQDCERFGAEGITVHPRPDERHIRYRDVVELKKIVKNEFNIEGRPEPNFIDLVLKVKPEQCTLVPDGPDALTSNSGWDTIKDRDYLIEIVQELKRNKIRVSLFLDPDIKLIEGAALTGADRIELYTESYASAFQKIGPTHSQELENMVQPFIKAALMAEKLNLGVNAGHDLNFKNLNFFKKSIPNLLEVSIGHALICDALYWGLENTIQLYLRQLK